MKLSGSYIPIPNHVLHLGSTLMTSAYSIGCLPQIHGGIKSNLKRISLVIKTYRRFLGIVSVRA